MSDGAPSDGDLAADAGLVSPTATGSPSAETGGAVDAPNAGDADAAHFGASQGHGEDAELVAWLDREKEAERTRLSGMGARVLPLRVRNMGIVWEEPGRVERADGSVPEGPPAAAGGPLRCVNRVELDTTYDFAKIKTVLVSEPRACPIASREGWKFVHVVLLSRGPVGLLLPYLYNPRLHEFVGERGDPSPRAPNDLRSWLFVNSRLESTRHEVDALEDVRPTVAREEMRAGDAVRDRKSVV
jgi:hypothetical protein